MSWPGNHSGEKAVLEAIIDVPIMIPHTVAGIAVLMAFSPKAPAGALLVRLGFPLSTVISALFSPVCLSPFPFSWTQPELRAVFPQDEKAPTVPELRFPTFSAYRRPWRKRGSSRA